MASLRASALRTTSEADAAPLGIFTKKEGQALVKVSDHVGRVSVGLAVAR